MSFLFKNTKSKQFNFKPVYLNPENDGEKKRGKKTSFTKEMYAKWDRIPFSELEKQGKKNALRFVILTAISIFAAIYFYDKIEAFLRGYK